MREKCNFKEVESPILLLFFKNTDPKIYLDTFENLKFKTKKWTLFEHINFII